MYQNAVLNGIADKVPNVRMKTAQIVKNNLKMLSPIVDKVIDKLKDDKDVEVREMSKKLRA